MKNNDLEPIGESVMTNNKHMIWIGVGMIIAFIASLLVSMIYHAILWAPMLTEIASVTWNDGPLT